MRFLKTLELVLQCLSQLAEIWDWLQTHELIFDVFSLFLA